MRISIILFLGFLINIVYDRIITFILIGFLFVIFLFYDVFCYFKKNKRTRERKQFIFLDLFFILLFFTLLFIKKDQLIKERENEKIFETSVNIVDQSPKLGKQLND